MNRLASSIRANRSSCVLLPKQQNTLGQRQLVFKSPFTSSPTRCAATAASGAPSAGDVDTIRILGISGSLRKASTNSGMLRAAAKRLPPGATFEFVDLSQIAMYNDDLWQGAADDSLLPEPVRKLRAQVRQADAVLLGCPEYNFSVSGALKNALDWGSRKGNVFNAKSVAVVGAGGGSGTARAQLHLRNICAVLNMHYLPYPLAEIQINRFVPGQKLFDEATGDVLDKALEDRIAGQVDALVQWTRQIKPFASSYRTPF